MQQPWFLPMRIFRQLKSILFAVALLPQTILAGQGIAEWQQISLGGVEQTILIRGQDRTNPILLFVHGGPGVSEIPLAWKNRALERDFVVVQWDQRGAGKSYRPDTPGMRVDQFVDDTLQLTRSLEKQFGQRRILLVGHSWGSLVGIMAVARAPELFCGYVGLSQLINIPLSERELDARARETARAKGDENTLQRLERLGRFPYPSHKVERQVNKAQKKLMGEVPDELTATRFISTALASPDYTLADDVRMLRGITFSGKALEREIYTANLFQTVPRLDTPAWFFAGRHDTVLSQVVAEQYFRKLIDPQGKHFVWFENSNHWPQIEETAKYQREMRKVRAAMMSLPRWKTKTPPSANVFPAY